MPSFNSFSIIIFQCHFKSTNFNVFCEISLPLTLNLFFGVKTFTVKNQTFVPCSYFESGVDLQYSIEFFKRCTFSINYFYWNLNYKLLYYFTSVALTLQLISWNNKKSQNDDSKVKQFESKSFGAIKTHVQ